MIPVLRVLKRFWFTLLMWVLVVLWWQFLIYFDNITLPAYGQQLGEYPFSLEIYRPKNIFTLFSAVLLLLPCLYSCLRFIVHLHNKSTFRVIQSLMPFTALIPAICLLGLVTLFAVQGHPLDVIENAQHRYHLVLRTYMDDDGWIEIYECDLEDTNCSVHYAGGVTGNSPQEIINDYIGKLGIENGELYVCIYYGATETSAGNTTLIQDPLAVDWNSPVSIYSHITHDNPLCQEVSSP